MIMKCRLPVNHRLPRNLDRSLPLVRLFYDVPSLNYICITSIIDIVWSWNVSSSYSSPNPHHVICHKNNAKYNTCQCRGLDRIQMTHVTWHCQRNLEELIWVHLSPLFFFILNKDGPCLNHTLVWRQRHLSKTHLSVLRIEKE